jgi:superfamily II DNA or RNA helicase
MKPDQLRDSQEQDILLATFSMASEGMDIPKLNTVILASPKSDVEQSVGRIFRQKADVRKYHPLIIDIQDTFSMFKNQSKKRVAFYHKSNFTLFLNGEQLESKKRGRKKKEDKVIKMNDFSLVD